MYHVLLPVDSSEERASAQTAATLALPEPAEFVKATVVHVFGSEEMAEKTTVEQTTAGKRMVEDLRDAGVEVETISAHGDPDERIVTVAEDEAADMIVMGGRKRSPLGALVFGSVSQSVILDSERPVAVTGAGHSA
ncbi:universal stress protein [Halomicroarcula sp. GCM10025709]|uniref:universal stress protein n=1 Tax=Haloarcula TaxID=2237 RepID=UPI0024C282D8|nr:universal stress protein [Halomicroarcula sp. YJ-61-S]